MKMNRSKKGFTLVEIMIVVVIIGLLAALAIPAFNKVRRTSQAKSITNNLRQLSGAAQQYFMETGAATVPFSRLVKNDVTTAYINTIQAVAGETYVATIEVTGTAITADSAALGPITFPY